MESRICSFSAAFVALLFSSSSNAGLISGFESGLSGWDYIGDVSVQSSAIGLVPTQEQKLAFISTMCDRNSPPVVGRCNTTTNEHPYSGVSSSPSDVARQFLGLPQAPADFMAAMPYVDPAAPGGGFYTPAIVGESGAMKTRFYAPKAGTLSFDWNRIGTDSDSAYFSLWSDDPASDFRLNDWIYYPSTFRGTFSPSGVDLCSRYYDIAPSPSACGAAGPAFFNAETGWSTKAVSVPNAGWYWLGFGLGEIAEGTAPTVLALDNVRFQVPEPATLLLVAAAIVGIASTRRRSPAPTA
jgi:hypothetical protein